MTQCTYPKCQATNGCIGVCSKEKHEWVGLTEHMKIKLADRFHISMDAVEAIEAKLKEKNS